ncbi:MAG: transglutaminase domain-containing protein [Candidatus Gracilibacteria bacterium]|nr:transglutaminase domain-containing protein [Candidatus Gracilibacteria bacterium]
MLKKSLIFLVVIVFSLLNTSFGYNQSEINLAYSKFYSNLEKNIQDLNLVIEKLQKLDKSISSSINNSKSENRIKILNDLKSINKTKINSLKLKKIKNSIELNTIRNNPFIAELIDNGYKNLSLNDDYEYNENNETFRFIFKKYYILNKDNYNYFIKNKLENSYIIRYKGDFLITNDYKIEKKYSYLELYNLFKTKIDYSNPYILINGEYFSYKYNYYLFFKDNIDGLYLGDLEGNNINLDKTLIIKNLDGTYFFSNEYKKVRLVNENIIKGITNKNEFLYNILDDNRNIDNNYDDILLEIKNLTLDLIKDKKTDDEKIFVIYSWVVNNIDYYKNYSDGNKQIFSGILTYKNKIGVCDGYTKLFSYMLSFAGINNVETKRGFAFDSEDFLSFGHAWTRIGDYYYDSTFDDPIGSTSISNLNFIYYKLPYDLIYVNRFDGIEIPEKYKNLSLNSRKQLVLKNMYEIYDKYKNYPLMSKIGKRISLGLKYDDNLTLDILKQKLPFYEVNNNLFYDKDGNKYLIYSLKYYNLNDLALENVFDLGIDLNQTKLFKWTDKNGNIDYRLAYDIKFY